MQHLKDLFRSIRNLRRCCQYPKANKLRLFGKTGPEKVLNSPEKERILFLVLSQKIKFSGQFGKNRNTPVSRFLEICPSVSFRERLITG